MNPTQPTTPTTPNTSDPSANAEPVMPTAGSTITPSTPIEPVNTPDQDKIVMDAAFPASDKPTVPPPTPGITAVPNLTSNNNPPPGAATVFQAAPMPTGPEAQYSAPVIPNQVDQPKKRSKKGLLLLIIPVFLLLVGSSAAYFGYVVPNKPANIWSRAMTNTGKGYDKLSNYLTTAKDSKGSKIDGSFKLSGAFAADGTIKGTSDGNNSESEATFSMVGLKITADFRSIKTSPATSPDLYFKVDGIQGLGSLLAGYADPTITNAINGINGQWYVIDHTLFDQYSNLVGANTQITRDDVNKFLNSISVTNKKYLFTSDTKKSVFIVKQNVGRETRDGRKVYHFKVTYNKPNLKSYVNEICNNFKTSKLAAATGANSQSDSINCGDVSKSVDNIDNSETADIWVDLHTKLIQTFRISDKTDPNNNYVDIGQNYTGGDEFPFSFKFHNKDGQEVTEGGITITLNMKTNAIKITGNFKTTGTETENGDLSLTIEPSDAMVNVTKPAGAKNIIQLLNDLGIPSDFQSVKSNAKDTERETDIKAVASHLEVYNAQNGYYPTLANLDSESWRTANLKGLDKEATRDPDGKSYNFSATPTANIYAYKPTGPTGKACDNSAGNECTSFTLAAILSDGSPYSQTSLSQ